MEAEESESKFTHLGVPCCLLPKTPVPCHVGLSVRLSRVRDPRERKRKSIHPKPKATVGFLSPRLHSHSMSRVKIRLHLSKRET